MRENEEMIKEFRTILVNTFGFIGGHILEKQMKDLHLEHGLKSNEETLRLIERLYEVSESFSGPIIAREIKKKLRKTASKYVNLTDIETIYPVG